MRFYALLLLFCLCFGPYASFSISVGIVDCPAQEVRLTPGEFASRKLVGNVTYVLSDAGEYQLQGEVNANNISSDSTTCFIGNGQNGIFLKAAAGKWHFDLTDAVNIRLGFKSLTLLGDRKSSTGGASLRQSLIAMEDVAVSNCGLCGVLLSGCPSGVDKSGHFTNVTFTGNTRALELTNANESQPTGAGFYGMTTFHGNKGGIGLAGPGIVLINATAAFLGPAVFENNVADSNPAKSGGAIFANLESVIFFALPVKFKGNTAGSAGAVFLGAGSVLFVGDSATFSNNTATANYGGAIALNEASLAFFNGSCSFIRNAAATYGGALYASIQSNASFVAPVILKENHAGSAGGMYMDSSILGVLSTFTATGNAAVSSSAASMQNGLITTVQSGRIDRTSMSGLPAMAKSMSSGALRAPVKFNGAEVAVALSERVISRSMSELSTITKSKFSGALRAPMKSNGAEATAALSAAGTPEMSSLASTTASPDGSAGALLLFNSSFAVFTESASFINNKGNAGGAIGLVNATVDFGGPVILRGNEAQIGGAVVATLISIIYAEDTAVFDSNRATQLVGGALACFLGVGGIFDKQVTFKNNRALQNSGGGIAAAEGTILAFGTTVKFIGNSAPEAGAVILQAGNFSNISSNITAASMHLIRNSATLGAGLVSDVGGDGGNNVEVEELIVSHNTAKKFAGGLLIGGNLLVTREAKFVGNTAGQYGAAAVVIGSMTLPKSCFIGNKAAFGGAALTVSGTVNFNTSNGQPNFHHNVDLNGKEVSTIEITPGDATERPARITCDGANPRPARPTPKKSSYFIDGPLCDSRSCPTTDNNCTCPAGTRFSVADCACGASANVQVALVASSSCLAVRSKVQLVVIVSAQKGDATTVHLTVDVPGILKIGEAPSGCHVEGAQLVCNLRNIQAGQSEQVPFTAKAAALGSGFVVARISSPQGVNQQKKNSKVQIIVKAR